MSPDSVNLPDLPAGTMVGEYRIEEKIGEGGMGQVYRAQHPRIGKRAAIKILAAQFAQDPKIVRRLLEEARAVNQIHHPNIVDIFSFGELPDGRPYFVMEYLEGESLETALARETLLPAEIIPLLEQLCLTLGAAHKAGFIHRDLKPENLCIVRTPNQPLSLKVLDFGIAKSMDDSAPSLTKTGQVLGTPYYMAPEQALGRAVDARTDIYAIGVILYRIVAGALPFDDESANAVIVKHATQPAAPPSSHRKVPQQLDAVIMRCLAKEPAERPQTAGDLWNELKPALEAWVRASAEGLSTERTRSRASSAAAMPTMRAQATILPASSRSTIQPVEQRAPERTASVAGRHPRLFGVALAAIAALVAAGALVVFYGQDAQFHQRSAEATATPMEAKKLPTAPDTLPAPSELGAIPATPENRDAGASPSPEGLSPNQTRRPHNPSHDRIKPIRL